MKVVQQGVIVILILMGFGLLSWLNIYVQPKTNFDESARGTYVLPELLTRNDGKKISSVKEWESQRQSEVL
ncbi:MAG: hypothetical protein RIB47_11005 [Cyclobacteriaceae bacterium]